MLPLFAPAMKQPARLLPVATRRTFTRLAFLALAAAAGLAQSPSARAANGPDTWTGATNAWSTGTNWSGTNTPPISGDSLVFGTAGAGGTTLLDDLMTPSTYNVAGITFNGPSAFTINPNTAGTNGFTLTGNITDSSAVTQTINDLITLSNAVHTFTLTSATDVVKLGGNISVAGTASNITTSAWERSSSRATIVLARVVA